MPYRLAALFAHPDDDTFGIGGTLALERDNVAATIVVATSGGAGQISDPSLATQESLSEVREREEREALAALAADSARVHFLRYPDGALDQVPSEQLVGELVALLVEASPDVVVTFGPEGVTKHPDHLAIHEAATEAFHRARGSRNGEGAKRLLYSSIPRSEIEWFWSRLRDRGVEIADPDGVFLPRGVPDETIRVRVDCRKVFKRKLAALQAHRTQSKDLDFVPEDLRRLVFRYECFVQAWPPTEPGGPVLRSVFEGLEPRPGPLVL